MRVPKGLLIDLDDTLICFDGVSNESWTEACETAAEGAVPADLLVDEIHRYADWYWGDPARHRIGRNDLEATRRLVVREALKNLDASDDRLGDKIGDTYSRIRDEKLYLFPGVHQALDELRHQGMPLCLVTNGEAKIQREKIERFSLERHFDGILIEGELGYGKPDERVFQRALAIVGTEAADTWVIGDNLEWEIAAPGKLGFTCVWVDKKGSGVPHESDARPDAVIDRFPEVLDLFRAAEAEG